MARLCGDLCHAKAVKAETSPYSRVSVISSGFLRIFLVNVNSGSPFLYFWVQKETIRFFFFFFFQTIVFD